MDNILVWNVRGLNRPQKQKEVRDFLLQQKAGLVCLLETKLKPVNVPSMYTLMFQNWCVHTNFQQHKGGRIFIAWLGQNFQVDIIHSSAQCIHLKVYQNTLKKFFQLTVVYAFNDSHERKPLWEEISTLGMNMSDPWLVTRDFNCPLTYDDRIGSAISYNEIKDFKECVSSCSLFDLSHSGSSFTCNNKQSGDSRVYSRIDRCLVNEEWSLALPHSFAHYHPEGAFDHWPAIVHFENLQVHGRRSFVFYDMWISNSNFMSIIEQVWKFDVFGVSMYRIVQKLKILKRHFKLLNKQDYDQIEERYYNAKRSLEECQIALQSSPTDWTKTEKEREVAQHYDQMKKAYQSYLSQKAK